MALDYNALNAITQDVIVPDLQDNFFNDYPILKRLRNRMNKSQDGGTDIQQPIIYNDFDSVGTFSGYSTIQTAANETITAVTYNWGHYYVALSIAYTDQLKNSGKSQIINLLNARKKVAAETLRKKMTADLFSASSVTNGIQGFPLMLDDDSSTDYAGINATDFSGWAASVDSSSTTMTLGLLKGKFGDVTDGNEKPTLINSNQDCEDKYWQLLEPKPEMRVQDSDGNMKFLGATWVVDAAVPGSGSGTADNDIEFINENFIQFYVHPKDNFKFHPMLRPVNQMVEIGVISWSGQLATSNRRRHGVLEAINPAL